MSDDFYKNVDFKNRLTLNVKPKDSTETFNKINYENSKDDTNLEN